VSGQRRGPTASLGIGAPPKQAAPANYAAKPPAPVAPVAPPTAVPTTAPRPPVAMPWDTNYETRVSGINRSRDTELASIQDDENRAKQEYGFDDLSDPFNKLKTMERLYQQSKAGAGNSMAAGGQLYSGAYQQAQNQLGYAEAQDRDSLRRSYDDVLGGLQQRRLGVKTEAEEDISEADYDRILAALQNRPEDPGAPVKPAVGPAAKPNANAARAANAKTKASAASRAATAVARARAKAKAKAKAKKKKGRK